MTFATRFNRRSVVGLSCAAPSLTEQRYKEDCNINVMVQRALRGDPASIRHGSFLDVSVLPESSHDYANIIARGETAWNDLPDSVKAAYGSVEAFLTALTNPSLSPSPSNESTAELPASSSPSSQSEKTASATEAPTHK